MERLSEMVTANRPNAADPDHFRRVLGNFPTGVAAITSASPTGEPYGMTVGSFTSVSLDPPLVAFLPDKKSSSFPKIQGTGAFCVNVLGADQERVCRSFAAKGADKFAGLKWHPASSGSPVLDGVVAWIDCDIHEIHDAGDHLIVVGKVRELDTAGKDLPLLFFQGGYGEFTSPWKTAPAHPDIVDVLRLADHARTKLIALANHLNVECLVSGLVADELVILASASKPGRRLVNVIGQRVPFLPPIGIPLIAWSGTDRIERWIDALTSAVPDADATAFPAMIDRVRERGWSLALASGPQISLEAAVARLTPASPTEEQKSEVMLALKGLADTGGYEPEQLVAGDEYQVRHISAPVTGPDGDVLLALNLYGLPPALAGSAIPRYLDELLDTAAAVGRSLAMPTTF
jgi:flavin reductase (DIM6/NTAB) family NADH-FMN oxidoreductase RutF/DNA-binding IclR family transcriptional regulator